MLILGIESSCDDTAAAVLDSTGIRANIVSSQFDIHARFGGIVPELAARNHIEAVWPVVDEALDKAGIAIDGIDGVAATRGPGLIGSLLVGFTFAKAIALVQNIPCIGVDHMAGHLLSVFLGADQPGFPYIALVVSGGNTSLFKVKNYTTFKMIGRTRDDAAGEAFDKVAKLLDLGYPGGPMVSRYAAGGDGTAMKFPRAWLAEDSLDFSFSGLKTAVANYVHKKRQQKKKIRKKNICASFQEAVVDVLVEKTVRACRLENMQTVVLGGGVAANDRLRQCMSERCRREGLELFIPPPDFCTDNGAMIALAGYHLLQAGETTGPDSDVFSRSPLN